MPAVHRVEDLGDAGGTGRRIGCDGLILALDGLTLLDPEPTLTGRRDICCLDRVDLRKPWGL